MEKDESIRVEIENRIIAKLKEITIREGPKDRVFIDFDLMDDFFDECQSLFEYFQQYTDTVMDVEMVRVYADLTRYFRQLTESNHQPEIKEQAQRWLDEMEGWMDDIIAAAARNRKNSHSTD